MVQRFIKLAKRRGKAPRPAVVWTPAPDIKQRVATLITGCDLQHVQRNRVFCFRSENSKTRAYARVWGLGRIWQQALGSKPAYVLEVISEKFDRLPLKEQDLVLVHELLHVPKTFSGALLPHRRRGGVNDTWVRQVYARFKKQ